jgi:hypothetical protein
MTKHINVSITTHSPVDKDGRQSLMTHVNNRGKISGQCYYANADEVLKRLRHNIASQYWFDKYRKRLAASA